MNLEPNNFAEIFWRCMFFTQQRWHALAKLHCVQWVWNMFSACSFSDSYCDMFPRFLGCRSCCERKGKTLTERCWLVVLSVSNSVGTFSTFQVKNCSIQARNSRYHIFKKCDIVSVTCQKARIITPLLFSSFSLEPEAKPVLAKKGNAETIHHYLSKT